MIKIFKKINQNLFYFVQVAIMYYTLELILRFGCYDCYKDNFQTVDFIDSIFVMCSFVHFSMNVLFGNTRFKDVYILSGLTIIFISVLNICLNLLALNGYVYYSIYGLYLIPFYAHKIKKYIL